VIKFRDVKWQRMSNIAGRIQMHKELWCESSKDRPTSKT